jgi:hypothetical protein
MFEVTNAFMDAVEVDVRQPNASVPFIVAPNVHVFPVLVGWPETIVYIWDAPVTRAFALAKDA